MRIVPRPLIAVPAVAAITLTAFLAPGPAGAATSAPAVAAVPAAATSAALAGSGTASDPYQISDAADLTTAIAMVNADTAHTGAAVADYELTANIDYGGQTTSGFDYFGGTFNGQGYTISDVNLTTDSSSINDGNNSGQTGDFLGLFKVVNLGTLEHISLGDITATAAQPNEGYNLASAPLAAFVFGSTITDNSVIDSTVTSTGADVGGLVAHAYSASIQDWAAKWNAGDANSTTISDNMVTDTTLTGAYAVGGILVSGQGTVTVSDNYVSATIDETGGAPVSAFTGNRTAGEVVGDTNSTITGGTGDNIVAIKDNVVGGGSITFTTGGPRTDYVGAVLGGANVGNTAWTESGDLVSPSFTLDDNFTGGPYSSSAGNADGTLSTTAALSAESTYTALGWNFGPGAWQWDSVLNQPTQYDFAVSVTAADGTASASASVAYPGQTVTLTGTPATGYTLAGWTVTTPTGGSVTVAPDGTFTMPDQDVAVTANFTSAASAPNTYTITFNGNGADGSMADETMTYGQSAALPANGFVDPDEVFAGWGTAAGGPVVYSGQATVSDLAAVGGTVTLYAQWTTLPVTAGSWPSLPGGFVTSAFQLPGVPVGGPVSQPLLGLWNGSKAVTFSEVSGDSWLSVSSSGVVSGTAPATVPQNEGTIVVSATDGTTTSQITVTIPVLAEGQAPQVKTASWSAWDDGSHVTDSVGKNLEVIASEGIDLIGFSSGGGAMAQSVASALGWNFVSSGDLGIVSAYPLTATGAVAPTQAVPALAVAADVGGQQVRVWDTALDSADYGPYNACFNGVTSPSALISDEESTTRYAQAQAVTKEMTGDVRGRTPVILLGDLESPSGKDWTAATASAHCGVGAVDWPVPELFARAGLADSFRVANPDPETDPGNTWSPIITTDAYGRTEPQDRIDYVDYSGDLHVAQSSPLTTGWPSATDTAANEWTSNHAAVVTTFTVGNGAPAPAIPAPVVTVGRDLVAYETGDGPADAAAFLTAVRPAATPGSTVSVDLSGVDFSTPGWYTAQVTATAKDGYVSSPADVVVRVAPVPSLSLGSTTATFNVGNPITQTTIVTQLQPLLQGDGVGTVHVSLAGVDRWTAGTYPVTVTGTDQWGDTVTQPATVVVQLPAVIKIDKSAGGTVTSSEALGQPGDTVTLTATPATGYQFGSWAVISEPSGDLVTINPDGTFTMPTGAVTVVSAFTPNTYTVTFDGNGATAGTMADETFTYARPSALTRNQFTAPAGEVFEGWATSATGTVTYTDGQVVKNLTADEDGSVTLYAVWTPVTESAALSPAAPDGTLGWYQTDPTITVTAADTDASDTISGIQYRLNGGAWTAYTGPVTAANGTDTYQFQATDSVGNTSTILTARLKVDSTTPTVTATATAGTLGTTVTITATDEISGIAAIQYSLDGGMTWLPYIRAVFVPGSSSAQTVEYRAVSNAGLTSQPGTLTIPGQTANGG